jgi:limonene-1,2-epoxide hydrolase
MADQAEDIARKFIGYFKDTWPENLDDPLQYASDDCYYQSIVPTTEPIRGKEAIKAKWALIREKYGDQRHDMKAVASNGRFVFTERTDWTHYEGKWIPIPLVAVFEVVDGKIVAWREYLDGGNVARQMGMEVGKLEKSLTTAGA